MSITLKDIAGIAKICFGALSIFLILFGIHWMAILFGVALGVLYYAIPKKYLY
jgi:hypothetical protein